MALNTNVRIPFSKFLDETTGRPSREWMLWLMSPDLIQLNLANAIPVTSGGTGTTVIPANGQILIGNGTGYTVNYLTAGTGIDISYTLANITIALNNSGVTAASYGTASSVAAFTVNAKGQITAASNIPIAISASQITSGVLPVLQGGTGASTAATARANLSAAVLGANNDITSLTAVTGGISSPTFIQMGNGSAVTLAAGKMWYDTPTGSWNLGMGNGNITQQIGEEIFTYVRASADIFEGQVITRSGTWGTTGVITAEPAPIGTTDADLIIGIATENISNNNFGRITYFGIIHGLNTVAFANNDDIWYDPTTVGGYTKIKPVAPNIKVQVGSIIKAAGGTNGSIQVKLGSSSVLGGTDSNVQLGTLANNDVLTYNSTLGYWTNAAGGGGGGSGTVTSVSGTGTVSGLSLSGTVTTSGNLTLGGALDLSTPPVIGASTPNSATFTSAALTSGTITTVPSNGIDIVNKSYVDLIAGSGIHIHNPVLVETPAALTATYVNGGTTPTWTTITTKTTLTTGSAHGLSVNDVIVFGSTTNGLTAGTPYFVYSIPTTTSITLSLTYSGAQISTLTNGTGLSITSLANSGVGATLTNSGTLAAINIDNVALSIGDRVLVYRQASAFQNGVYTVTTVGSGAVAWVLTRATDANKYSPNSPSSLGEGDYFFVQSGDTGKGESYVLTTSGTLVFGTTNLTFTQFSDSAVYSAGTGLTLSGTTFSITPVGTAGTYGSASSVPVITTNASGQVSSVTNTPIAILGTAVSGNISGNAANITGTYAGTITSSQVTTGLGFTPYNATNPAGYTSNTGTVTSVAALTLGTTGTDLSSTVSNATSTPVITLQVPTASATNRGALSSTDWSTFNGKQAALGYTPVNKAGDTMTGALTFAAGTATAGAAPLYLTAGTNLTTAAAGAIEFDTANTIQYFTGNTTNGRGITPNTHYFRLAANGAATATTISPFFGANSSLPLVANGVYEIEIECYFLKTTAGTLTWTLTNSAVVTSMQANFTMSPITGVATAGAAPLMGFLINQTAAAAAFGATGSLTTAVNHWIKFKIILENASSTSIRLNVTNSAGTVTPLRGSFWKATRITNAGTYAA